MMARRRTSRRSCAFGRRVRDRRALPESPCRDHANQGFDRASAKGVGIPGAPSSVPGKAGRCAGSQNSEASVLLGARGLNAEPDPSSEEVGGTTRAWSYGQWIMRMVAGRWAQSARHVSDDAPGRPGDAQGQTAHDSCHRLDGTRQSSHSRRNARTLVPLARVCTTRPVGRSIVPRRSTRSVAVTDMTTSRRSARVACVVPASGPQCRT